MYHNSSNILLWIDVFDGTTTESISQNIYYAAKIFNPVTSMLNYIKELIESAA